MKIDDLIIEKKQRDPEFARRFETEKEKLQAAVVVMKAREEAGLSQRELAARANTTQVTIARIEHGQNVSLEKLISVAHALNKELKIEFV